MELPEKLLQSLQHIKGFNKNTFIQVHAGGDQITSIRFNPAKLSIENCQLLIENTVPWSSQGYYLSQRPSFTFDPLFHAGCYYVQEASGMFLEQALKQTVDLSQPLRVLDLCAAPGGKSTLLQSLINTESLLVSNEVIKPRVSVLEENMTKWGAANTVITNNDPVHFARLENYFDVIVVDAPCSGSGLFRRDPEAVHEWSENNVQLCSQRQQRIIADVWPALKQDGMLIYSTCSYSEQEDEAIVYWICEALKAKSVRLKVEDEWQVTETVSEKNNAYGYRFYPDKVKGEGFFIAALQKKEGAEFNGWRSNKNNIEKLSKAEELLLKPWLKNAVDIMLFKQKDDIIALPACFEKDLPLLQAALYIRKAGVMAGKLMHKDLVPDHALALSSIVNKHAVRIELNRQQAIQYLRRQEIQVDTKTKGWALVGYEGHNLGWIKVLANRINNYYPTEWRIVKQPV